VNRLTLKQFKHAPAVHTTKQDMVVAPSNIYSISEQILLKWINYHLRKDAKKVVNFDKDLVDSLVIANLILAHVPNVKRLTTMYQFCTEKEHFQHNANNVVGAIKDIGLEYSITVKDILEPNPCGKNLNLEKVPTFT
jgi:hypothetical protein